VGPEKVGLPSRCVNCPKERGPSWVPKEELPDDFEKSLAWGSALKFRQCPSVRGGEVRRRNVTGPVHIGRVLYRTFRQARMRLNCMIETHTLR